MGKHAEVIRTAVASAREDGESHLETILVNYNGMVRPPTTGPPGGMPGGVAPPTDPLESVTFPSARQMAIALTDRRLLIWSLGFSGKPKQFIGAVPVRAVIEASIDDARFGGVVRLTLRSGAKVDLEAHQGEPAASFVEQLEPLIGA